MRLLVFQHIECEHPGSLRDYLASDGIRWDAVNLDQGDPIPTLENYDALWVMGGPMDVWDVDEHPWLIPEKESIRTWVCHLNKPFLGICLGHQLLADALGGTCGPQNPPEIGILDIELTQEGRRDRLFAGLPAQQKCLQWHSVAVMQPPEGATILARSELCGVQAMRVGAKAWSMQYHVELEADTIDNWAAVPAYRDALMTSIGQEGFDSMKARAKERMASFTDVSARLYRNFMEEAAG